MAFVIRPGGTLLDGIPFYQVIETIDDQMWAAYERFRPRMVPLQANRHPISLLQPYHIKHRSQKGNFGRGPGLPGG